MLLSNLPPRMIAAGRGRRTGGEDRTSARSMVIARIVDRWCPVSLGRIQRTNTELPSACGTTRTMGDLPATVHRVAVHHAHLGCTASSIRFAPCHTCRCVLSIHLHHTRAPGAGPVRERAAPSAQVPHHDLTCVQLDLLAAMPDRQLRTVVQPVGHASVLNIDLQSLSAHREREP